MFTKDDIRLSDIEYEEIREEMADTLNKLEEKKTDDSINYAFLTDTHIDTTQSVGNVECVENSIRYAKKLAELGNIDYICIAGDFITGWFDRERALNGFRLTADAVKGSTVPIVFSKGNHDNNRNPKNTGDNRNPDDWVTDEEIYDYTQATVREKRFSYDESVEKGLYFYFDVPEKKTRVINLDSCKGRHDKEQLKWLIEKVLTVKDEGFKYVFMSHIPIDIRYESEMPHEIAESNDIKLITTAINTSGVAHCSFGDLDYSDFKSKITVFNFGHTHLSYMEWNDSLKCFCVSTGCTGSVGCTKFDVVSADDERVRKLPDNSLKIRYLFDVISVNTERIERIRFGNGCDKQVKSNY